MNEARNETWTHSWRFACLAVKPLYHQRCPRRGLVVLYCYWSLLLYGCTTWTLTKRLEKKLYGNYTRMLRAILNNSWRQHPTKHQLYGHLPPITKTIHVRRIRHAGHCWRSRDELISDVFLWTPAYGRAKAETTSTNIHSAAMWGHGM